MARSSSQIKNRKGELKYRPKKEDPLSELEVFDLLEVGPVRVEPNRLVAPYRVVQGGIESRTELIYRYEEDVFDPSEPASHNLAGMIAAQVAVNYGLFCRTMVFQGTYDEIDRRFIRDMAENTAREIFIKKFLEENPFIVGTTAHLPPVKTKKYLRASLQFADADAPLARVRWELWQTHRDRFAVLSSGGKDSLTTFGLMDEVGGETHPIFVNESGRHWFTALNAYRYFSKNIRNTGRVWVNSDRLFNWMLRRMPFVRDDFADIRADIYPIRLWTVAVFLFGILPLMRKRGIRNLLIGDEFDTSRRGTFQGIPHYDGLYDQSRYFDTALSRYFLRKGWSICQYSILRPLSELLIEKILAQRYPKLQAQQMSCHAAHKKGDRIYPCGNCEKCRRIVTMLLAIDADPQVSGYREDQAKKCLAGLVEKGVHQESADAEHLLFMLANKGLIASPRADQKKARPHPEVLKLRFDQERSPLDGIPLELRLPLYHIYLKYADGAVKRFGRVWKDFDPSTDPEVQRPYAFEVDPAASITAVHPNLSGGASQKYLWGELTWPEAQIRLEQVDIALLPVGAVEQHGPHLPLDTDAFDADYLARKVAETCSDPKPLVLPLIAYGVSYHHHGFKGTVSIQNDTLSRLVYEVGISASQNGIKKLVIINGHGGNSPAINYAAQMINRDARIFVCVDSGETSDVDIEEIAETSNDVHAGEIETSTSLAVRPHLVKMDLASKQIPEFSSRYLNFSSRRGVSWYAYTEKISPSGIMGDPEKASAEKGEKIWEMMIAHMVSLVEDLKNMTLDEIHHRRY